jgi:hypothetical protein
MIRYLKFANNTKDQRQHTLSPAVRDAAVSAWSRIAWLGSQLPVERPRRHATGDAPVND